MQFLVNFTVLFLHFYTILRKVYIVKQPYIIARTLDSEESLKTGTTFIRIVNMYADAVKLIGLEVFGSPKSL